MAFIVFEGVDGCGKSTLLRLFSERLTKLGVDHYLTREPGGTPLAEEIRQLIIRKSQEVPHPRAELLLYEAARAQHVEQVIRPKLKAGQWVLSDRFTASTIAFQAAGRGLPASDIQKLNDYAVSDVRPDLNVLLDLTPEKAAARRALRESEGQQADRFESEKLQFHQRVYQSYCEQLSNHPDEWLKLNAEQSPEELLEDLVSELQERSWL